MDTKEILDREIRQKYVWRTVLEMSEPLNEPVD
jgi:hypothetical protein